MALKYIDEFRDGELARAILQRLKARCRDLGPLRFMEICGTHTVSIFRSGLRELLPSNVELISGPGCPVCVTANEDIDRAIWFASQPEVIVTTFGDLLRVPGSRSSLLQKRGNGADVRMVYATFDAVQIAKENPDKHVVFIGIGFETTAPTVAAAVQMAAREGLDNFSVFSAHKVMPPVMAALLESENLHLDGFLCPGHVTTVIGAKAYQDVVDNYGLSCVVTGFEALDILQGLTLLVEQRARGKALVEIQYRRGVTWEGNPAAQKLMNEIFEPADAVWRGLGKISGSGLAVRPQWARFDAAARFDVPSMDAKEDPACRCGDVLRGALRPPQCPLFRKICTPQNPKGPCMVSSEGTCGAYYRYHRDE
ncbi:hydrogenase expression/formation protein HypD [Desulfacinum hydrothermale DSM 13146]|uniref:Hydrogenase expression/formation protein HypD n=1 Tax=Desulfacinum hydrothermale DSM 13146 TaxID=1121390 RepID=A0A1W1XBM1_9BACT|nr:hydrogenase formation protein HypD [Desulfacinum hydrothermale]SMC21263.1 hydrogenase expression/formation protein HypD [Desulfacinum hydrothermale DSM 13146]